VTVQDHAAAVVALLEAVPLLTVYDGEAPKDAAPPYVLVYTYRAAPDAGQAPDKSDLTFASRAVELWIYAHCVGVNSTAARQIADDVEGALLDVTPTVANRSCFPIRWREGSPSHRDEETLRSYHDLTDVYALTSIPG
jgi:hypothetical protein